MGVDEPAPNRSRNVSPTSFMKPADTTRSGSKEAQALGEGAIPCAAVRIVADPVHERGEAGPLSPGESLDARPVGAHSDHLRAIDVPRGRVDERLKIGPGAGYEHDQAS